MTTVEVLREARKLIRKGWTQRAYARDKHDAIADIYGSIRAPRLFCMEGACMRAVAHEKSASAARLLNASGALLRRATHAGLLPNWNDHPKRTKGQVVAAFTKAIELAGGTP